MLGGKFGIYSFKVASFKPSELDLKKDTPDLQYYDTGDDSELEFQVRQLVFYILYLPVFPIKKIYRASRNGEPTEVSDEVTQLIKAKGSYPAPWYSYSFFLVALLAFGIYSGYQRYTDMAFHQQEAARFYEDLEKTEAEWATLSPSHFILVGEPDLYRRAEAYLKIEEIDGDHITVAFGQAGYNLSAKRAIAHYEANKGSLSTIKMERKELDKLLLKKYPSEAKLSFIGGEEDTPVEAGSTLLADGRNYAVKEVINTAVPLISCSVKFKGKDSRFTIKNKGSEATLIEVRNTGKNPFTWTTALPLEVSGQVVLMGEHSFTNSTTFAFELVFEDTHKNLHTFRVSDTYMGCRTEKVKNR